MVKIAKVDCTLEKELCNQEEVTGYPTLRFYAGEASDSSEEVTGGVKYQGKRDLDSLETWLRDKVEQRMVSRSETTTAKPSDKASLEVKKEVRDLNAETFHGTLSEGSHFVEFFAPWCGHCQRLHPVWESLGLSENVERSGTSIGRVDCTSQRDVCKEVGVAGYPTLIFFREGVRIEEYNGGRSLSELEAYVDKMSSMGGKSYNAEQLADVTTSPSGALVRFFDRGSWVMEWMRLAQQAKSVGLRIAEVDCALSPGECAPRVACMSATQKVVRASAEIWKSVVGLEVHAQMASKSKLFSRAGSDFYAPINSLVSPFDAAHPGTLPVLNRRCVEDAVKAALALNCQINLVSYFDRKHYFYADLPAGYQITQQRVPIAVDGRFEFLVMHTSDGRPSYLKEVRVKQVQIEQDSGKSLHMIEDGLARTLIDLNRAGVGLMEIVFEPDVETADEAVSLVRELAEVLELIGASSARMDEGAFRVDVNVSVNRSGEALGTRTEVKNIGSANFVGKAVDFEIQRQIDLLQSGKKVENETRAYSDVLKGTVPMRDKEVKQDYRFMPEPNLPPLRLTEEECRGFVSVEKLRRSLPELPEQKRNWLAKKCGLSLPAAMAVLLKPDIYELFNLLVKSPRVTGKKAYTFIFSPLMSVLKQREEVLSACSVSAKTLQELCVLFADEKVTSVALKSVLNAMMEGDTRPPEDVIEDLNLWQLTDPAEIERVCEEVIQDSENLVTKIRKGKNVKVLMNTLVKAVRTRSGERIASNDAAEVLTRKLNTSGRNK
ncbi:unnamed protein product [Cyprideis torosa]|uniref:Glutamyl-tRNA(Gln) amidotransferase subunit B, mitochondrial n=1 Tax=Cyprideis torosa TaxID=163714 RepID=A0A7R8WDW9_9CRUS|nr:unnamed protein product [Cyprideis torosa]CAG0888780.1 unnamed protein product [Cyprideis torosa]